MDGPQAMVERLVHATNDHDIDALVACFAEDYENETPARGFRFEEVVDLLELDLQARRDAQVAKLAGIVNDIRQRTAEESDLAAEMKHGNVVAQVEDEFDIVLHQQHGRASVAGAMNARAGCAESRVLLTDACTSSVQGRILLRDARTRPMDGHAHPLGHSGARGPAGHEGLLV